MIVSSPNPNGVELKKLRIKFVEPFQGSDWGYLIYHRLTPMAMIVTLLRSDDSVMSKGLP